MPPSDHYDIIIAGAGQAGAQCAQSLRQGGFAGTIALLGEEPVGPYERPPLSKDYLGGKRDAELLLLRKPEFWVEKGIDLRTGCRITGVDAAARRVTLAGGSHLSYGHLVWATGGRPRPLPCSGADLRGVHAIRTIADIDGLKIEVAPGARAVIIGGGYIGLETAAVLRDMGMAVTVLEAQGRLLARVTSPPVSQFFLKLHQSHGVDVQLCAQVEALTGQGRVTGVRLVDGRELPADIVIVGVGIIPNVEPLAAAGLACPNGVQVDAFCRTSDPHILGIGDCARHPNPFAGSDIRLESVQNAIDQAKVAADTLLGRDRPYAALPWFWSDQYDVKMQSAGLALGQDTIMIRGEVGQAPFSVLYLRDSRLVAIDCINNPKDFMQAKALIAARRRLDTRRALDRETDLRAIALED